MIFVGNPLATEYLDKLNKLKNPCQKWRYAYGDTNIVLFSENITNFRNPVNSKRIDDIMNRVCHTLKFSDVCSHQEVQRILILIGRHQRISKNKLAFTATSCCQTGSLLSRCLSQKPVSLITQLLRIQCLQKRIGLQEPTQSYSPVSRFLFIVGLKQKLEFYSPQKDKTEGSGYKEKPTHSPSKSMWSEASHELSVKASTCAEYSHMSSKVISWEDPIIETNNS